MNPERWRRLKEVFGEALEQAGDERASFLARVCADDPALSAEVESLLVSHEGAGGVLDTPLLQLPAGGVGEGSESPAELARGRLGPYQLLREIGHGGMGTVYLAARVDQEYRKNVAIKVIRRGMDSEFVVSRFRNERQILAALVHPNVAALLDGGTTEDGLPYFVMEYVEGEPIDRYCDAHRHSITRRLELFLAVCGAVQYAHRSLVVHRDLKPGNILVTREGVPKLLDFGVAKLLDGTGVSADETSTQLRFVTVGYASPEQILGGRITTASDVYSLGALLYLLLTGQRAYASATVDNLARAACEEEPSKPSEAGSKVPPGQDPGRSLTPEGLSALREGTPDKLRRRLAGDLDTIVLKAMRKEPGRRYASVEQLSEDIRRHLGGHPVLARPANAWYRIRKFAARNRIGVAATALVVLSVAGGFVETSRQRARAERRFADVRKLANSFLFEFHDAVRDLPGSTKARALVVKRAQEYLDNLAHEAAGDRSLQRELAEAYEKLGEVQGSWVTGLGDIRGATASLQRAVSIREAIASDATGGESSLALARSLGRLGIMRATSGDRSGIDDARRALGLAEAAISIHPEDPEARRTVAWSSKYVGQALAVSDDHAAALPHFRRAVTIFEGIVAADPKDLDMQRALANSYYDIGSSGRGSASDRLAAAKEAEQFLRKAIAINVARVEAQPTSVLARLDLSFSHMGLGEALKDMGQLEAALESFRRTLALCEVVAGADAANAPAHLYVAEAHAFLGETLVLAGSPGGALDHLLEASRIVGDLSRADPKNAYERVYLAQLYSDLGGAEVDLARGPKAPGGDGAAHWRSAQSWYAKSQEIYRELREQGKMSANRARDSENNAKQLVACDAALATSHYRGIDRQYRPPR